MDRKTLIQNMQLGFNENIIHNDAVFHIQTEDGGRKNPTITTLLFKEGTIMASRKTSYADIIKSDKLENVVKEIMRDQHGAILKDLKNGVFDNKGAPLKPTGTPIEKTKEKENAPMGSEKSLDDIILEYLSLNKEK